MRRHDNKPPKIAEYIIKHMFPDNDQYTTVSDLEEDFQRLCSEKSTFFANLWYWLQLLSAFPHFFGHKFI